MKSKILSGTGIFFLLFILFFPLSFMGSFQKETTLFFWGDLTEWLVANVFKRNHVRTDFSSDSISMFVLTAVLLILSLLTTVLIRRKYIGKILYYSKEIIVLYLAVVLMEYGFDKVFKAQFYLPEPNILYSRFGNLHKDILFWSTMGTSRFYSISAGVLELLAALLILFRTTRIPGLLLSAGILINIFLINIGFDISVKLFSAVLLSMVLFALNDEWIPLYRFFILKQETRLKVNKETDSKLQPFWVFFKTAFVGLSLAAILFPYVNTGNYNDDRAERPFLHGAFRNLDENSDIQYVFFHRNSYLILMDKNERMTDFHYTFDAKDHLILEDDRNRKTKVDYVYHKKDSLLTLRFGEYTITGKELNWRKMNALQPLFHAAIEDAE
ncbi:hypothetical protein ACM46_02355 [Chryseobacterium angstadtii]|uniref:DoxX family protein n=1 Tax=Chryseobacterium angstadtii TaxID=558151 RepID=A0A0J7IJV0_9FLAO|nr:hypothetical protein [Chryseobacterium angstadtii]KMQ66397.1 hypothetical protein ACM46_02355 [Chryseobacterium angstadtii]